MAVLYKYCHLFTWQPCPLSAAPKWKECGRFSWVIFCINVCVVVVLYLFDFFRVCILVIRIVDAVVSFGITLTKESLFKRNVTNFARTTLKSTIAAGMLR